MQNCQYLELHQCQFSSELPAQSIRKAIDALHLKSRAEKEIELLKEEMSSTIEFYKTCETIYTKDCIHLRKHHKESSFHH